MYKYNNLNYESEALINLLSLKSIDIEKEYGMLYLIPPQCPQGFVSGQHIC